MDRHSSPPRVLHDLPDPAWAAMHSIPAVQLHYATVVSLSTLWKYWVRKPGHGSRCGPVTSPRRWVMAQHLTENSVPAQTNDYAKMTFFQSTCAWHQSRSLSSPVTAL